MAYPNKLINQQCAANWSRLLEVAKNTRRQNHFVKVVFIQPVINNKYVGNLFRFKKGALFRIFNVAVWVACLPPLFEQLWALPLVLRINQHCCQLFFCQQHIIIFLFFPIRMCSIPLKQWKLVKRSDKFCRGLWDVKSWPGETQKMSTVVIFTCVCCFVLLPSNKKIQNTSHFLPVPLLRRNPVGKPKD